MSVTLTLTFPTTEALLEYLRPSPAAVLTEGANAAQADIEKPKRGRPPKAADKPAEEPLRPTPLARDTPPPADAEKPKAEVAGATLGTVRAKLSELSSAYVGDEGMKQVSACIAPFGVKRISELKAEQYPLVIDAAEKLLVLAPMKG